MEITGGGALVPELQPERIVAVKYPNPIKAIQALLLIPCMAKLLSQLAHHSAASTAPGASPPERCGPAP